MGYKFPTNGGFQVSTKNLINKRLRERSWANYPPLLFLLPHNHTVKTLKDVTRAPTSVTFPEMAFKHAQTSPQGPTNPLLSGEGSGGNVLPVAPPSL